MFEGSEPQVTWGHVEATEAALDDAVSRALIEEGTNTSNCRY
jgi:hypothetical protein